jgi:hypothetical protein
MDVLIILQSPIPIWQTQSSFHTLISQDAEAFICEAPKGEAIVCLLQALNNKDAIGVIP